MENDSAEDPAEALNHLEFGTETEEDAARWAADEMLAGRSPEEIAADLVAQGWENQKAEEVAEFARKATRQARGIVTRDDVASMVEAKHRRATTGMTAFFRSGLGLFAIFGYFTQLRETIRLHRQFKAMKKRTDD